MIAQNMLGIYRCLLQAIVPYPLKDKTLQLIRALGKTSVNHELGLSAKV